MPAYYGSHFQHELCDRQTLAPKALRLRIAFNAQPRPPLEFEPAIAKFASRMRFRRNETIFIQGERSSHFHIVVSGVARCCIYLSDGRRQITNFIFPDDYVGQILEPLHCDTVEAVTDLEIMRCSLPSVLFLTDKKSTAEIQLFALLSRRVHAMEEHVMALGRQTAQERVALFLIMLFEKEQHSLRVPFKIPMSRPDMADYLGLTTETVSREITRLKRKRLITAIDAHLIAVNDVAALRELSGMHGERLGAADRHRDRTDERSAHGNL